MVAVAAAVGVTSMGAGACGARSGSRALAVLRADPLLAAPARATRELLRNERGPKNGVLGASSAYVTVFWASGASVTAVAQDYRRRFTTAYRLHTEFESPEHVVLSGIAAGDKVNVRVEITSAKPIRQMQREKAVAALPVALPGAASYTQVTVSSG